MRFVLESFHLDRVLMLMLFILLLAYKATAEQPGDIIDYYGTELQVRVACDVRSGEVHSLLIVEDLNNRVSDTLSILRFSDQSEIFYGVNLSELLAGTESYLGESEGFKYYLEQIVPTQIFELVRVRGDAIRRSRIKCRL